MSICRLHFKYLKWFLPVVLELSQIVFGAAPSISHPAEAVREELPDVGDPVVVEAVHHALDHLPRLLGLGHVRVSAQHSLLRAGTFRHACFLLKVRVSGHPTFW